MDRERGNGWAARQTNVIPNLSPGTLQPIGYSLPFAPIQHGLHDNQLRAAYGSNRFIVAR